MKTVMKVVQGDITTLKVDAIVNAANSSLMGGGGVDGAIHRAGGPAILEHCKRIVAQHGPCPTSEAVITTGGNLPAKFVIHTVGPVWGSGEEAQKLKNCYLNSLRLALDNQCRSVAFPNISTGVYGYPKNLAAEVAVEAVHGFLQHHREIEQVVFCCFDTENFHLISHVLNTKE